MESLWGLMEGIPEDLLIAIEDQQEIQVGDTSFIAHHTPGHANHHIAWQMGDLLFTGDVAGCKILDGPIVPPCPPPDINIEAWKSSIEKIRKINPSKLYLTHFGIVEKVNTHLEQLTHVLDDWSSWMYKKWEAGESAEKITPEFQAYVAGQLTTAGLDTRQINQYEAANPAWMSVAGLLRYWTKKSES